MSTLCVPCNEVYRDNQFQLFRGKPRSPCHWCRKIEEIEQAERDLNWEFTLMMRDWRVV